MCLGGHGICLLLFTDEVFCGYGIVHTNENETKIDSMFTRSSLFFKIVSFCKKIYISTFPDRCPQHERFILTPKPVQDTPFEFIIKSRLLSSNVHFHLFKQIELAERGKDCKEVG
jgi:hypothetical protein